MKRSTAAFFAVLPLVCFFVQGLFFVRTGLRNNRESEQARIERIAQWGEPEKSAFGDTAPFFAAYGFVADALHHSITMPGGDGTLLSPTFKATSLPALGGNVNEQTWLVKGTIAVLPKAGVNGRSLDPQVYRWKTKQGWDADRKAWYVVSTACHHEYVTLAVQHPYPVTRRGFLTPDVSTLLGIRQISAELPWKSSREIRNSSVL